MIKVNIQKNNEVTQSVLITGHAGFADHGNDIVCASVSSITITSVNAILSIDNEAIYYEELTGRLQIKIIKNNEVVNKLITNMLNMLNELATDYPKNIQIRED